MRNFRALGKNAVYAFLVHKRVRRDLCKYNLISASEKTIKKLVWEAAVKKQKDNDVLHVGIVAVAFYMVL